MMLIASDGETRRLATIMASDVVGYTSLMGTDEAGTVSTLRKVRRALWGPKVEGTAAGSTLCPGGKPAKVRGPIAERVFGL